MIIFKKYIAPAIAFAVGVTAGCGGGGGNVRPDGLNASNPSAIDIGNHWQSPDSIAGALDATPTGGDTSGLTTALGAIEAPSSRPSSMHSVNPSRMSIIGSQGDITVGRWTSGPADTMDVAVYYDQGAELSDADKATIKRAAKAWTRHIRTEFDDRTVTAGTVVDKGHLPATTLHTDVAVDDFLIVVSTGTQGRFSWGGSTATSLRGDELTPGTGYIHMNSARRHLQNHQVIMHEIGHALIHTFPTAEALQAPYERYVSADGTHFEGPEAMKVHGGPVPFQWVNAQGERVAPGTPGAMVDRGHLDVCTSVMAYCAPDNVVMPSALDIAWLQDLGYETLDAATALAPEVYGYGAWGTYSAWGVGAVRTLTGFDARNDHLEATADAFGIIPASTLEDASTARGLAGSVSWTGLLLGVDTASNAFAPVTGDAMLNVDLETLDGTAAFDNLTVHANGETGAFRSPSLEYAISVDGNRFEDAHQRIDGGFYGPDHEEMAGVLDDRRTSVNLVAGFGGSRDE